MNRFLCQVIKYTYRLQLSQCSKKLPNPISPSYEKRGCIDVFIERCYLLVGNRDYTEEKKIEMGKGLTF